MAATNKLTDHKIKALKASGKLERHSDRGGLYLHMAATASKLWRMAHRLDGKQQTAIIGTPAQQRHPWLPARPYARTSHPAWRATFSHAVSI